MIFEKYKDTIIRLALVAAMSFVMAIMLFMPVSAADYNCGAYGAGSYNNGTCVDNGGTDPNNPGPNGQGQTGQNGGGTGLKNGGLINTGQALSIAIPAVMILLGTFMLYRLGRKRV